VSKRRGLTESLNNAIEGLVYAFNTQRNLRLHFGAAIAVLLFSMLLGLSRTDFLILLLTISFVIIAEMFNTVVEMVINITKEHYHPLARNAKDVAAGCVLLAAANAFCVGYILFIKPLQGVLEGTVERMRLAPWYVSLAAIFLVLSLTILIKRFFRKGTPFLGGMPSGHSAFAFSLWTLVALFQPMLWVTLLVLVLATLVARHRVRGGYHTVWEAAAGALLGIVTTTFVVRIFLKT